MRTPLHYAAAAGAAACVALLLRRGAALGATDEAGATPLALALQGGAAAAGAATLLTEAAAAAAAAAEVEALRSPELKPMPSGSPEPDGNVGVGGGGGGGSGGDAAAAGRRRFAGSSRLSLFRQPFGVGGSTKVRVGQTSLVSGAQGELLKRSGADPELERRSSFDSPGIRNQAPAAVTFPSERGGRGGGGGGGGGSSEGSAADRPLGRVEEPVDECDELRDELQPPRSPSYGMPRVTLHRRSRSEPPRDLTAVRVAAVTVLQDNSPAE